MMTTEMYGYDLAAAAQLAALFHSIYERLAPEFGYETRLRGIDWENLPPENRQLMIATAGEVLKQLDRDPGEELAMLVSKKDEKIRVDFQQRLRWFAMEKNQAINFALTILQHCGVPVNITLNPPPADSQTPS